MAISREDRQHRVVHPADVLRMRSNVRVNRFSRFVPPAEMKQGVGRLERYEWRLESVRRLPKDIQRVGIATLVQEPNPLAEMGEGVGWIQAHRFVHLTHRRVEQADVQVDEAELMVRLV